MEIKDWPSSRTLPALYRELKQLDLLENVAELEAFGFTIVPPEKVGPGEQHEAARDAVLKVAGKRKQCALDELPEVFNGVQELFRLVLWEDPIFEKLVLNPAALGLVQWLVGTDCVLSLCDAWVKGRGQGRTDIHADWAQFDLPAMAPEAFTANFNYLLTDYSKEEGALSFVPSSNRWRRLPSGEESQYWADNAHIVEAPAGSMVIWGDHTWHGSYPKTTDGFRLMLLGTYCRPHMQTQEAFRETVPDEALARNPRRFTRLMNVHHRMPWGKSENVRKGHRGSQGYLSLFDIAPAGEAKVVRNPDYGHYDLKTSEKIFELIRGQKIKAEFPDMYKGADLVKPK